MGEAVFALCALTSLGCGVLLWRSYSRTRARLLLWSSICFGFFALNNILLCIDLIVVPTVDLSLGRAILAAAAIALMNFGLIWDAKS